MTGRDIFGGIVVSVVGGVILYWATTGYSERQQNQENLRRLAQQEAAQQAHDRQAQAEAAAQQAHEDAARKRAEDEARKHAPRMSELEVDVNRGGSDYRDYVAASIGDCLQACLNESGCKAITFNRGSRQCWMKSSVPLRSPGQGYTSSVRVGGS